MEISNDLDITLDLLILDHKVTGGVMRSKEYDYLSSVIEIKEDIIRILTGSYHWMIIMVIKNESRQHDEP